MEEKTTEDDIIYDLDHAEEHSVQELENSDSPDISDPSDIPDPSDYSDISDPSDIPDISENSDSSDSSDISDHSDSSDSSDYSDHSDISDPHEEEIKRMVKEMGAETLLSIIKDNRNAAIRQIISEVEASRKRDMPTGASASATCSSIFDLAALA